MNHHTDKAVGMKGEEVGENGQEAAHLEILLVEEGMMLLADTIMFTMILVIDAGIVPIRTGQC